MKAAKVIHGRVQLKRILIYFGLDTLKKCGLRHTMHDVIEFDDIMKVVKRVLPAVQQLILGQTGPQNANAAESHAPSLSCRAIECPPDHSQAVCDLICHNV